MKLNSRKSKVMVVGKKEAGVSWKIGEELVEEVEVFKYSGVWVDKEATSNVQLERMPKKRQKSGLGG